MKGMSCFAVDPNDGAVHPARFGPRLTRSRRKQKQAHPSANLWDRNVLIMPVPELLRVWDIQIDLICHRDLRIDVQPEADPAVLPVQLPRDGRERRQ